MNRIREVRKAKKLSLLPRDILRALHFFLLPLLDVPARLLNACGAVSRLAAPVNNDPRTTPLASAHHLIFAGLALAAIVVVLGKLPATHWADHPISTLGSPSSMMASLPM